MAASRCFQRVLELDHKNTQAQQEVRKGGAAERQGLSWLVMPACLDTTRSNEVVLRSPYLLLSGPISGTVICVWLSWQKSMEAKLVFHRHFRGE